MAPEVFSADQQEGKGYNELCDIWSVGVIAYQLLTGKLAFNFTDPKKAEQRF
jgi:serine/threonine protein kinase